MSEKLKSFWENRIFHFVMTKNWTHDLPVDKGAFEGGSLGGNRADEHFLLLGRMPKSLKLSETFQFFSQKKWGTSPLSPLGGKGDFGRGQPLCNELRLRPE